MRLSRSIAVILGLIVAAPAVAATGADRGQVVFKKCKSCHQIGEGAENRVGPNLNDLIGRPAGAVEGFRYSRAMQTAATDGLIWDEAAIDGYLANPRDFMKGTRMSFRGLKNPDDRTAVIAYLAVAATAEATDRDPAVAAEVLAMEGDPDYGEYLSGECVTCHSADGADKGIPSITGWDIPAFVTALHAYRGKHRDHEAMQLVTSRLTDEEIAGLAAYFGGLE